MKLHLPKGLLVAVLAAVASTQPSWAAGTGWGGDYYEDGQTTKTLYMGGDAQNASLSGTGIGTIAADTTNADGNLITSVDTIDTTAYMDTAETFIIGADGNDSHGVIATIGSLTVHNGATIEVKPTGYGTNRHFENLVIEALTISDNGTVTVNVATDETATLHTVNGTYAGQIDGTLKLKGSHEFTKASALTGSGTVVVQDGAVLTLNTGVSTSSVTSHIAVQAGGKLSLAQGDALGWSASASPKSIVLTGESDAKQAMMSVTGRQTTATDITLNGYSGIEGTGSIQLFGCDISATGKGNVIASTIQTSLYACEVNVSENGELEFSGNIDRYNDGSDGKITKTGAGVVTFSGADSHFYHLYTNSAGTTNFTGESVSLDAGMTVASGKVEFAEGTGISLGGLINVGTEGGVVFNGNTLTLQGIPFLPILPDSTITQNGTQTLSTEYTIASGNVAGVSGFVKIGEDSSLREVVNGKATGAGTYRVIAESGSLYDENIEAGDGYVVTNQATFDLNLADDGDGFQPHLYLDKGTTITNGKTDLRTGNIAILNMSLLGDATVEAKTGKQFGMLRNSWYESTLSLNGHVLTKTGDGIFHMVNTTVSNGTIDVAAGTLLIDSKTGYHTAGTVFNDTVINVQQGGTLRIDALANKLDAGALLTSTTGTGVIRMNTDAFIQGTTRRDYWGSLVSDYETIEPTATKFEGDLIVGNSATLYIGHDGSGHQWGYYTNLSSLRTLELATARIHYHGESNTIKSLLVSGESTINIENLGGDQRVTFSTMSLNANLNLTSTWASRVDIGALTGTGNLTIKSNTQVDASTDVNLTIGEGYSGTITLQNNAQFDGSNTCDAGADNTGNTTVAVTIAEGAGLKSSQIANATNATISLKGAGTYTIDTPSSAVTNGLNQTAWSGKVAIEGQSLKDADMSVYGHSGSTISFKDTSLALAAGKEEINSNVILNAGSGAALKLTSNATLSGSKISGSGSIALEKEAVELTISGDVSEWKGDAAAIWGSEKNLKVTYSGAAKEIHHAIQTGNTNSDYHIDITYQNSTGMQVNGNINSSQWGHGSVSVTVLNEENASGQVTFHGSLSGHDNAGAADITVKTGAIAEFTNHTIKVKDILVEAAAQLSFSGVESLSVAKLETNTGATVTVGTIENHAGKTLTVTDQATLNGGTINADLTLADNAKVAFNDEVEMGSTLTLGTNLTLSGTKLEEIKSLTSTSQTVVLFTGVDTLTLGEQSFSMGTVLDVESNVKLSDYFVAEDSTSLDNYFLGYNAVGDVYAGLIIPEPATATLSLLALAGLCARRRRKS